MPNAFQINISGSGLGVTRWNLDDTFTDMSGMTPVVLGYAPAPFYRMAYDRNGNCTYMVFGTKLWYARLQGNPNIDLLWKRKPLANGADVVTDISGDRVFGSMDCCGCKIAMAHWYGFDRKITFYDISSDSIHIQLIDSSTNYNPFYSACCFADNEILYAEYTDLNYHERLFFAIYPDGAIKRLADPLSAGAISLLWANNVVYRLDSVGDLHSYDPVTDTWTDLLTGISGMGNSSSLHRLNDDELIGIGTGNANPDLNRIWSYKPSDSSVTVTHLTTAPQINGGKAAFVHAEPTGSISFDGNELTLCVCIKISRQDGIVMGFTTHDNILTIDGTDYSPIDAIQATAVRHELGTGIGNLDVQGLLNGTVLSSESITETELRAGTYDGARVDMFIADWLEPSRSVETIITGTTGEVQIMQGAYVAEVRGLLQRMSQQIGSLTSPTCRVKRLGDVECKIDLTSYRHVTDVSSVQSPRLIVFNDTLPSDYYTYGICKFTSGANAGLEREIKSNFWNFVSGDNEVILQEAFPYAVQIGDDAILEAGCDRILSTCINKFNNILNFRGEPYVPGTDQLIQVGRMN